MGDLDAVEQSWRSFPPRPESAGLARAFTRDRLEGQAAPEVVHDAELLISELVTNVVLHARTEVEVSVRAVDGRVHGRAGDRAPQRGLVPRRRHPYTDTGRGLYLVERLASRYGVDTGEQAKTVWFELGDERSAPSAPSGWGPAVPLNGPRRSVTLADLPWALSMAATQHRHALLRELVLATAAEESLGVRPDDLDVAHDINNVISACLVAAAEDDPSDADVRTLTLSVAANATPALLALRRVLDTAEEAARGENLLTRPALPQSPAMQQWMLDEIIGQLGGGQPTAWTVVPRELTASPLELVPWDADQIQASRVPTVATDDRNRIVAVNESAADLVGWDADDLVGQRLTVLIPEHLRERHQAAFTSLLLTGRPRILGRAVPLPALHSDGRLIPVRLRIQSQELHDGRTLFVGQLVPRTAAPEPPPPEWPSDVKSARDDEEEKAESPYPPYPEPRKRTRELGEALSPLERLSLLTDSGHALSSAQDLTQGLRRVGEMLTLRFADWCVVDLLDDHHHVERCAVVGHDARGWSAAYEGRFAQLSNTARGPLARALRGAGPLLLTEAPTSKDRESPLDARYAELLEQLGVHSAVIAPLWAHRQVLGTLTLVRTGTQQPFTEADLAFVKDIAWGVALGVRNAQLYSQARNTAERLQHSLLPALPEPENLQIAARYAPSALTAQVGGDWYDAFFLPDGDVALAIGDVAGHDIDATTTMSRLSSMMRGIAIGYQEPPQEVVNRLDMANRSLSQEATATCIYAIVKGVGTGPWELVHTSAGHLPPLLTTQDGGTRYLEGGAGLMLGTGLDVSRPASSTALPAHSTVLLYTDGLIERRGEPLEHSLDRLRDQTAALVRAPLEVFCDELLIRLGADSTDDIALIALRPTAP